LKVRRNSARAAGAEDDLVRTVAAGRVDRKCTAADQVQTVRRIALPEDNVARLRGQRNQVGRELGQGDAIEPTEQLDMAQQFGVLAAESRGRVVLSGHAGGLSQAVTPSNSSASLRSLLCDVQGNSEVFFAKAPRSGGRGPHVYALFLSAALSS
jgi:hypothetical protein